MTPEQENNTGGDFFWQVVTADGTTHYLESVTFNDWGTKWSLSRELSAAAKRSMPGETVLIPWDQIVEVRRRHIRDLPVEVVGE